MEIAIPTESDSLNQGADAPRSALALSTDTRTLRTLSRADSLIDDSVTATVQIAVVNKGESIASARIVTVNRLEFFRAVKALCEE